MLGVALLGAVGVTQAVVADPAVAASALSCDQNTLYAINTTQNQLAAIDATTGAVTNIATMDPANNALAVARNGVAAYAAVNGGNTITGYDAVNGARTADVTNADPAATASCSAVRSTRRPASTTTPAVRPPPTSARTTPRPARRSVRSARSTTCWPARTATWRSAPAGCSSS